jgi:hypothetical protein
MSKARDLALYAKLEPTAGSRDALLVKHARELARLQNKRRTIRAKLREVDRQIKTVKRDLRTTMNERAWDESGRRSKIFGGD